MIAKILYFFNLIHYNIFLIPRYIMEASAKHILVGSQEAVDFLKNEIDKGTHTFEEFATMFSKCPSGEKSKGSLGTFKPGQMVPEFDKVIFSEAVGEVHQVKTQFGYHLLVITSRT
jgi:peptidyl-prolyl cis-trans isomerase C